MKRRERAKKTHWPLVGLLLVAGCAPAHRPPIDLLLTNARVIVGDGQVLERASVLIDDGRILEVRPDENAEPFVGSALQTIDLAGRTLLPGLIDTHVHLLVGDGNPEGTNMPQSPEALSAYLAEALPARLRTYLEHGITTVASMGDYFPEILELRERSRSDIRGGPRLLAAGPLLCAKHGHPVSTICGGKRWCSERLTRELVTAADGEAVVTELAAAKVDMIKAVHDDGLGSSLAPEVLQGIVRAARARELRPFFHPGSVANAIAAVEAGADRLVHPPWADRIRPEDLPRLTSQKSLAVATTMSISSMSDRWEVEAGRKPAYVANVTANLKALAEAGVSLAMGTDVPMLPVGEALELELRLLQEAGFSPEQILQMATRNAAAYLGILDEVGTVEPGKAADLLIVNGDPAADLSALRQVRLVLRHGQVLDFR